MELRYYIKGGNLNINQIVWQKIMLAVFYETIFYFTQKWFLGHNKLCLHKVIEPEKLAKYTEKSINKYNKYKIVLMFDFHMLMAVLSHCSLYISICILIYQHIYT